MGQIAGQPALCRTQIKTSQGKAFEILAIPQVFFSLPPYRPPAACPCAKSMLAELRCLLSQENVGTVFNCKKRPAFCLLQRCGSRFFAPLRGFRIRSTPTRPAKKCPLPELLRPKGTPHCPPLGPAIRGGLAASWAASVPPPVIKQPANTSTGPALWASAFNPLPQPSSVARVPRRQGQSGDISITADWWP